jgi:hypothetical protein
MIAQLTLKLGTEKMIIAATPSFYRMYFFVSLQHSYTNNYTIVFIYYKTTIIRNHF